MRIRWIGLVGLSALALAGCPGTLPDQGRFFVDGVFVWGDLSVPPVPDLALFDAGPDAGPGPDDGPDLAMMVDPCGDVPSRVFAQSCGGGGCHGGTNPQNNLDLESPGVSTRVVRKPATECAATLADPKSPDTSLLYTKLAAMPPCGAQMPLGRPPLSNFDIACVRAWIAAQP